MACGICHFAPTETGFDREFERFILISMPTAGLFIGWFIAYLATPIKMRPDTTFISNALATGDTSLKAPATAAK